MNPVYEADRRMYLLVHSRWRARWLDPVMVWATKAGTKGVIWLGLAVGLLVGGHPHGRWAALLSVAALLLAEGIINVALKPLIHRERPFFNPVLGRLARLLVEAPGPHSWPSAHAGSSAAAAVVLAASFPEWTIPFLVLGLLIGYSRVYVGVHYPLDVLAGILVGLVVAGAVLVLGVFVHGDLPRQFIAELSARH